MGKILRRKDIQIDEEPTRPKKSKTIALASKSNSCEKKNRAELASQRKEQILQAALRVFARSGSKQATNQAIAKEAGFSSPALIYHYFTDRQDLLVQVVRRFHPIVHFLEEAERQDLDNRTFNLRNSLRKLAEALSTINQDREKCACFRVIFGESLSHSSILDKVMEDDITNQITGYLNKLFTKAQELGIIRRDYSSMQLAYSFSGIFSVQFIHVCLLNQADFKLDMDMQIDCFLNGALAKDV